MHPHALRATLSARIPGPGPTAPSLGWKFPLRSGQKQHHNSSRTQHIWVRPCCTRPGLPCSPGLPLKGRNVLYLCCFSCLALEPTGDHGWPRRMDAVDRNAWDWLRHASRLWVPTARWLFLHLCFWLVLNTWKLLFVQEAALPLPMPVSSHL